MAPAGSTVLLRRADVAVLVAIDADGHTAVVHWGADLGDLGADARAATAAVTLPPAAHSALDRPVRVGLVPEPARTGDQPYELSPGGGVRAP